MKNKLKSVRRGSKSASASQSKIAQSPAGIQAPGTVTCVFYNPDGRESFRVDFPRALFALVKRCASKDGITLAQFFHNAVRHYDNATGGTAA